MAKRGRPRKSERKGYFYEAEEQAVIDYIKETDKAQKNKIFNEILFPALTKMIESIIRRYKLYVPDEEFKQTFDDTISYLLTKINNFKPNILVYEIMDDKHIEKLTEEPHYVYDFEFQDYLKNISKNSPTYIKVEFNDPKNIGDVEYRYYQLKEKHYKAYSYCGTVCKNYLFFKNNQFNKRQCKMTPYDTVSDAFENDIKYSTDTIKSNSLAVKLISATSDRIKKMMGDVELYRLNENEIKVGNALIDLLDNWEDRLDEGSNKMQKSCILYYLRESTMMSTKEVRDNSKKFRKTYYLLKKKILNQ